MYRTASMPYPPIFRNFSAVTILSIEAIRAWAQVAAQLISAMCDDLSQQSAAAPHESKEAPIASQAIPFLARTLNATISINCSLSAALRR